MHSLSNVWMERLEDLFWRMLLCAARVLIAAVFLALVREIGCDRLSHIYSFCLAIGNRKSSPRMLTIVGDLPIGDVSLRFVDTGFEFDMATRISEMRMGGRYIFDL
jgi:hypothetical protein